MRIFFPVGAQPQPPLGFYVTEHRTWPKWMTHCLNSILKGAIREQKSCPEYCEESWKLSQPTVYPIFEKREFLSSCQRECEIFKKIAKWQRSE